jgi:hypothetical protein
VALLETLTLQVGPAIGKAILKCWLKDAKLASDTASSLMDILKAKTTDVIIQQRAKRQLEGIGERVAESLLPVFEIEGVHLDEGSRNAVAMAVVKTLENARIGPLMLAKQDLDPTRLTKYLIESYSNTTRHFSVTETALYQRILSEVCQSAVDIASEFPAFTEQTTAEVLRRESQLLNVAERILEEVHRIRQSDEKMNPAAEVGRFEIDYRRAVIRKLDELELFGVDISTASRRYRLSVAYVTLSVQQRALTTSRSAHHASAMAIHYQDTNGRNEDGGTSLIVEEALSQSRLILIRGLAGSGKTTLLKWVAVHSASRDFQEPLSNWNDTIPFFIRLRQCVESGLPRPEHFPRLVVPAIVDKMPDHWVHAQLTSGRALVLIDGIDEIPVSQRHEVRAWLKELVETFTLSRFIVTSRPSAIEEEWLSPEGFSDTELQPMQQSDIYAFIDHWHAAVGQKLSERESKDDLVHLAADLKTVVERSHPIRALATNPLLCAMLCALHRDRHRHIPTDRIRLYEACCEMLLERRDIERGIPLHGYVTLTYLQKRAFLQDLAYWLLHNEWSWVSIQRVKERLERKLFNMRGVPQGITGDNILRLFIDRSGIVQEPVTGQVDFIHRTFQELLAAQAAVDEGDIGFLVNKAHDDQWREVIILAAGLAGRRVREELISELLTRGDREESHRHTLHLPAVACMETSVELTPETTAEVHTRLAKVVPPKNTEEARALASAGELAVPYLTKDGQHKSTIAAACVHTLSLIRSELALEAIETYRDDERQEVVNELWKARDAFNRVEYARRILSAIIHFSPFALSSLQGFQYLDNLTSLNLENCKRVRDLSPLAGLTRLTSLNLENCKRVRDLSALAGLAQLTSLNLRDCERVDDLSPLVDLTRLTSLSLWHCRRIHNLSPLAGLTQLISLNLWGCEQVGDLNPLAGLTRLTSLDQPFKGGDNLLKINAV